VIGSQCPEPCKTVLKGCGVELETEVYPDPRFQAVLRMIREEEISQAVDRLRLIHAPAPKLVVLLTKVDAGMPVDLALPWPMLRGKMVQVLDAMRSVPVVRKKDELALRDLGLTAGDRGKDFNKARQTLCKAVGPDEESGFQVLFPAWRPVQYRTVFSNRTQSGLDSKAWVHESVADVEEALMQRYRDDGGSVIAVKVSNRELTPETPVLPPPPIQRLFLCRSSS
jgi:hypothetical protein